MPKMKNIKVPRQTKKKEPIWKGPEEDGVTQTLLSRFLVDRERFRLMTVHGIVAQTGFSAKMEFGNMWHLCEEKHSGGHDWQNPLERFVKKLKEKYELDCDAINHWWGLAKVIFPMYLKHWKSEDSSANRTPLMQEMQFTVPYLLPSGRTVTLRGKFDSVDLHKVGRKRYIYLKENKTKEKINEFSIQAQLNFDLQTMMYLVALKFIKKCASLEEHVKGYWDLKDKAPLLAKHPIAGIKYNVIRRPSHKPSAKKGENRQQFEERIQGLIKEDPGHFFMRWDVPISDEDIDRYCVQFLDPILEQLWDWWEWVRVDIDACPYTLTANRVVLGLESKRNIHFRYPHGVYNPLLEGNPTDIDDFIQNGSRVGITTIEDFYPELSS